MIAEDDKPPLLKSWQSWYFLVLAFLVIEILVLYFITSGFPE